MNAPGVYPQDAPLPLYAVVEVVAHDPPKRGVITGAAPCGDAYRYDVLFFEPDGAEARDCFRAEALAPVALPLLFNERAALCALLLACQGLLDAANPIHLAAARVDARKALDQLKHMENSR